MGDIDLTEIPISRDMICYFRMRFILIQAATALTAFAVLTICKISMDIQTGLIIYIYIAVHEHTADTQRFQSAENL
ncbi:unnamed protein product [Nezara viridula]|uniref:Uncharacterized protein n=1 Tax=Nezara viridula TaxID=85310 RepID=A0A9P0MUQ0_NEZVI|nr:unnamed protein product [Nezara viridula]